MQGSSGVGTVYRFALSKIQGPRSVTGWWETGCVVEQRAPDCRLMSVST